MKNLTIKALNMEMTPAIEDYFISKLGSLDKYLDLADESIECDARVSKVAENQSGNIFKAEVSLHTAGKIYGADSTKDNLYASIDDVVDRVGRKITEHKDKQRSMFKRGAAKFKNLLRGFKN